MTSFGEIAPDIHMRQLNFHDSDAYFEVFDRNRAHIDAHDPRFADGIVNAHQVAAFLSSLHAIRRPSFGVFHDDELIGATTLATDSKQTAELMYWLDRDYTGRGLGAEACRQTINFGIEERDARHFKALISPANIASIKTVEKLGFERATILEDDVEYRLTASEPIEIRTKS